MKDKAKESLRYVEALCKGFEILERVALHQPISLLNLANMLGIHKSRILRLCGTMEHFGYIVRDENKQYRLGFKVLSLGQAYERGNPILTVVKPLLEEISKSLDLVVKVEILVGDSILCLVRVGDSKVMSQAYLDETFSHFHSGVSGKLFLTYGPPMLREKYFSSPDITYCSFTPHTITSPAKLYEALNMVKKNGYCLSTEETMVGAASIGVPVFKSTGELLGTLVAAGESSQFCSETQINKYVATLLKSAKKLSKLLIY